LASGNNPTFRLVGIATAVAALGSIFASKLHGATAASVGAHYATALNDLFLITAILALAGGVLALVLIRPRDFHVHVPQAAGPPAVQTDPDPEPAAAR
jgi:hypothetical protein